MTRRRRRRYYYSSAQAGRSDDPYQPVGLNLSSETKRGIAIVLCLAAALVSLLALLGLAGSFGRLITDLLQKLFGSVAFATPVIFIGMSMSLFFGRRSDDEGDNIVVQTSMLRTYVGAALFVLAVTGMLHLSALHSSTRTAFELVKDGRGGGYVGLATSFPLNSVMGFAASLAVLIALLFIALLIAFDMSVHGIFRGLQRLFLRLTTLPTGEGIVEHQSPVNTEQVKINTMESSGFAINKLLPKKAEIAAREPRPERMEQNMDSTLLGTVAELQQQKFAFLRDSLPKRYTKGHWQLPPTDLLEQTSSNVKSGNIEANVKIIKKTLQEFNISVEMGEVNVGPTVAQYTFRPAVGVKLAQIVSLERDLALALAASSIRIEAPIPGKSLVGIEVPNTTSAVVRLKELIESDGFTTAGSTLNFALGRDVAGHPMFADLEKMPHLLIAGASGMGKSVCLNAILTSFLYENSPEELQIIIIDPKRVDLTLYSGIPHLLCPVVTDYKKAINALRWAVAQMDGRYQLLSESGKRNIQEYNYSAEQPMPFLVIVVDELAQLMILAKNEVETAIVRLAQMARAVGIHLLLATQRPSVDVITGLIKANITTRIAFGVASQIDSRTILDMAGAESLLGRGDMLYQTPDLPKPKRIQAPFIATPELNRVLNFIKEQSGPVDYQDDILEKPKKTVGITGDDDEADGDMINAAIEEIARAHKASASLLQRRLSVGYARAARILDILEERGLIGPSDGAKPREIYIDEQPPPD